MLSMWFITFVLSVYLTAQRHVLTDQMVLNIFGILAFSGCLTVIVSYLHLTYLSPLSRAREDLPIDVEVNTTDEEE